jgi:hypothetical protein
MRAEPAIEIGPSLPERIVYLTLYYWAVVLAGFVLVALEALVAIAVHGEFAGKVGPVGTALLAVAWMLLAVPFVGLARRVNTRFLDRSTWRLTPRELSIGRRGQTEVSLDTVHAVHFVARRLLRRPRCTSADRHRFHLMLLVLTDGSLVPLAPPAHPNADPLIQALIAALEPKLRDREPLPAHVRHFLGRRHHNRRRRLAWSRCVDP